MPEKPENLESEANEALKERALEYIRMYQGDMETLRKHREDALRAYNREPYPEDASIPEGSRSKFVMSDVADTIEWILPSLMRIFYSGKEVVKIDAQGPEDEAGADLLNEKVNWDFQRQNNGFMILYDLFKASMLDKHAVVKYWWEKRDETEPAEYDDLGDDAYQLLQQDPDFVEESHDENVLQEEIPEFQMPRIVTHSVKGSRIINRIRRPVAEVMPPEEFIGSLKSRDFKKDEFIAHKKRVHKFDLMRDYEIDEDDLDAAGADIREDRELQERFRDLGGIAFFQDQEEKDFFYIYECYLKEEIKDKKQRVPIKLTLLGNQLIGKEKNTYEHAPMCSGSPIRMPHRAIGKSISELVMDLQKLRSSLARFILTNIYYQTDSMGIVNPYKINVGDFLTNRRPGGLIRMKVDAPVESAYMPLPPQPLAGHAFGLLEKIEGWKENRTGVTKYNQGTDADSLNKTATGISQILAASQQRIELIARIFAETVVKDLLTAFAKMNIDYLDMPANIRLNQGWQTIDPKQIDINFDVTVDVALGTGTRETKIQQLMSMEDRSLNPLVIQSGVFLPNNLYELKKAIYTEMGYKNPEKFLTQPPPPMPQLPAGVQDVGAGQTGVPGAIGPANGNSGAGGGFIPPGPPDSGQSVGAGVFQ